MNDIPRTEIVAALKFSDVHTLYRQVNPPAPVNEAGDRSITADECYYNEGEGFHVATVADANEDAVKRVLEAPIGENGRSNWKWIRLTDGTLVLGVFPHGDTYIETELDPNRP